MKQRDLIFIVLIVLLLAAAIFVVIPGTSARLQRGAEFVLGLDLRGGVQALLEVPASYQGEIDLQKLEDAQQILENRTNALGVSENLFQVAGDRRILAEFPGLTDPEGVLSVIKETGQLEFVDLGDTYLEAGTVIKTDLGQSTVTTDPTLAEVLKYAPDLRSMTAGRGMFTMKVSHYEEVPAQLQEKML